MPISSFVHHYKVLLDELLSRIRKDDTQFIASNCLSHPSSTQKRYGHTNVKILKGEDIGVILLGRLKVYYSYYAYIVPSVMHRLKVVFNQLRCRYQFITLIG